MSEPENMAVVLIGHGSRMPDAGEAMERVASGLKRKYGYDLVEVCYMELQDPPFADALEKCVDEGATKVLVVPYFLHVGRHMLFDIPRMLRDKAREFPHVRLIMGRNLGFDESLVDLVRRRIEESVGLGGVEHVELAPKL